jgi:hypothetical protein
MPPKLEVTALETKITQLKRAIGKTETIVNNGKEQAIVRHVDTIKETLSEVNKLRREIEATKISEGVNDKEIDEWNIESVMEGGDEAIEKLQEWLKTKEFRLEEIQHEQKAEREKQEQEKRIEFELKFNNTRGVYLIIQGVLLKNARECPGTFVECPGMPGSWERMPGSWERMPGGNYVNDYVSY